MYEVNKIQLKLIASWHP